MKKIQKNNKHSHDGFIEAVLVYKELKRYNKMRKDQKFLKGFGETFFKKFPQVSSAAISVLLERVRSLKAVLFVAGVEELDKSEHLFFRKTGALSHS